MARSRLLGTTGCLLFVLALPACERAQVQAESESEHEVEPATPGSSAPVSDEQLEALIGGATRLAAGDLDGDGVPELVLVDDASLRVVDPSGRERARQGAPGAIQFLEVTDVDLDGHAEILTGWGYSRDHRDAPARASILRLHGGALTEDVVLEPTTERAQIVALLPVTRGPREAGLQLLVAHFASKYMVELAHARWDPGADGWQLSPFDTIRMADKVALGDVDHDGVDDIIVGRVYGDDLDSEGDAFLLRPDGARVPIPVVGGVRSLAVADLDRDGRAELLIGDGWNRDYGHVARARLTCARWDADAFVTEVLDEGADQYTLWDLLAVDLQPGGELEIVTRGNKQVQVLTREGGGWSAKRVASECTDLLAVELDGRLAVGLACEDGAKVLRPRP